MKNWDRIHLKKHLYQNLASFRSHLQLASVRYMPPRKTQQRQRSGRSFWELFFCVTNGSIRHTFARSLYIYMVAPPPKPMLYIYLIGVFLHFVEVVMFLSSRIHFLIWTGRWVRQDSPSVRSGFGNLVREAGLGLFYQPTLAIWMLNQK